jgi:hypothetical protein
LKWITLPIPVSDIQLEIKDQALKMAYMDLQPKVPNGKSVLLLHEKNFSAIY